MYSYIKNLKQFSVGQAVFLTIIAFFLISSCKDNTLSSDDNFSLELAGNVYSYVQDGKVIDWEGKLYNYTVSNRGLLVSLEEKTNSKDTIIAEVDPTLVEKYNQKYRENNSEIPKGAFQPSKNGTFIIDAGHNSSTDSLFIELKDGSGLVSGHFYLVPVKLTSIHGNRLRYSVVFFKMKLTKLTLGSKMHGGNVYNNSYPYFRNGSLFFNNIIFRVNGKMPGPDYFHIDVALNFPFPDSDIQVEAMLMNDAQTIQEFSKRSGSSFTPFPTETYILTKKQVEIKKGYSLSRDSLRIEFPNKEKFEPLTWYLLGIKLKKIEGSETTVSPIKSDSSMAYISFFII
jgi:hypothetical protein